jgi:hypothetical protein
MSMNENQTETETGEFVDVLVTWDDKQTDTDEVVVVIGDGSVAYDENYDYDPRVYFYFDNREQFELAKTRILDDINFQIIKVLDEKETE